MCVLRARTCSSKLVGRTLGIQLSRRVLEEIAEVPVALLSPEQVVIGLKQDLVATLSLQHAPRERDAPDDDTPVKKARRDPRSKNEMLHAKTSQCLWVLTNRLAARRATDTLLGARDLIADLEGAAPGEPGLTDLTEVLVQRQKLALHMLFLDGAVDRLTSDLL